MTPPRARLAAGLLGCALLAGAGAARGVTFTVTSSDDSGLGTLREAINLANAAPGADVIQFDAALQDTSIVLASSLPDVTDELAIEGGTVNVTLTGLAGMTLVALDAAAVSVEIMDVNLAQGDVVVGDGVIFSLDQTELTGTVPGRISGNGGLEKLGPDVLILQGINTYAGGTGVREGTLQGDDSSLQGDIVVDLDAELVFDQAGDGNYAGDLSGEGSLLKIGAGTLILSGTNTHSGGTQVDEGILQGNTTSLQGDIAVETADPDTEGLVFNQTDNGTYAGALSGVGSVFKRGAGQLTLSGDNSGLAGDFVFEDGTLFVDTDSAPPLIVNEGDVQTDAVVLLQSFDGSFSGEISGPGGSVAGSVAKGGSGNVSLEGILRAEVFTIDGPFTLTDAGTFEGGELRLASSGFLQGAVADPTLVLGSALLDGTVAPGGTGGVAQLRTDFDAATFRSGSTLQIEVDETDGLDLFEAQSVVVEGGAQLDLVLTGEPFFLDEVVLEAPGGLSCPAGNEFCFEFDQDFFFFDVTPTLNATQLLLSIEFVDQEFVNFAQTPNELAVAQVLDTAQDDDELGDFFASLGNLQTDDVPALLNALSGEIATGFATPRLAAKQRLDRTLELQVRGFASRAPGFVPAAGGASSASGPGASLFGVGAATGPGVLMAFQPEPGETGFGAWIDGYGVFGSADGSNGAGTLSYGVYGTTLGLDARISEHFLVGAAAGYARLEPELRSASGTGDLGQGSLFAAAVWDRVHLAGWGRYAYGSYETRRPIRFGVDVTAKGSFDGWDCSGHGEAGVRLFTLRGFELRSLASIDYAYLEQDGYTEKGAVVGSGPGESDMNLQVPGQSWNSLVSGLGARVHRIWELQEGIWFVPEIHARWLHEFEDTDRRVVPTLLGVNMAYSPFIQGAELERDGMVAGIGWTVSSAEGLHVYGDYEINWNPKLLQNAIKVGFRFLF